jgi:hypothetical protein
VQNTAITEAHSHPQRRHPPIDANTTLPA